LRERGLAYTVRTLEDDELARFTSITHTPLQASWHGHTLPPHSTTCTRRLTATVE
jgi:hypothetical protein